MEERKLRSMVILLVDMQMKKMEIKMKHFEELEKLLEEERQSVSGLGRDELAVSYDQRCLSACLWLSCPPVDVLVIAFCSSCSFFFCYVA